MGARVCVRSCVCACMCVRLRAIVCVRLKERERESVCVCVCVCERERERQTDRLRQTESTVRACSHFQSTVKPKSQATALNETTLTTMLVSLKRGTSGAIPHKERTARVSRRVPADRQQQDVKLTAGV